MDWTALLEKLLNNFISIINPSWPQLILILSLVFMLVFHQNIRRMLDRAKQVGRDGVFFESAQNPPPITIIEEKDKSQHLLGGLTTLLTIKDNLQIIEQHLISQNLNDDPQKIINLLKHDLADVYFILRCERVYNIIFGTQIQLLKQLQQVVPNGLSQQSIDDHFNKISKHYDVHSNFDSNKYMFFLIQAGLVIIKDGIYHLTNFGADFLTWLQRAGLSENKPL